MAPQLSLSAGAGLSQWVFGNEGGNLYVAPTTVAGTATTSTTALTILNNGNVGIGTTTPTALFVVATSTSLSPFVVTSLGNVGIGRAQSKLGTLCKRRNSPLIVEGADGSKTVSFGSQVDVRSSNDHRLYMYVSTAGLAQLGTVQSGDDIDFSVSNGATSIMRLLHGGNVGIGTTGPNAKLEVVNPSTNQVRLSYDSSTNYTDLYTSSVGQFTINSNQNYNFSFNRGIGVASGYGFNINSYNTSLVNNILTLYAAGKVTGATNGDWQFNDGTNNTVMFQHGGNVGIGTTAPVAKVGCMADGKWYRLNLSLMFRALPQAIY